MEYKLNILSDAHKDISAIYEYISKRERGIIHAEKVSQRIYETIYGIGRTPNIGGDANLRFGVRTGNRYFPVINYPYIIFYEILKNEVNILRVIDGRRDCLAVLGG